MYPLDAYGHGELVDLRTGARAENEMDCLYRAIRCYASRSTIAFCSARPCCCYARRTRSYSSKYAIKAAVLVSSNALSWLVSQFSSSIASSVYRTAQCFGAAAPICKATRPQD